MTRKEEDNHSERSNKGEGEKTDSRTGEKYTPYTRSIIFNIDQTTDVSPQVGRYEVDENGNPKISHVD